MTDSVLEVGERDLADEISSEAEQFKNSNFRLHKHRKKNTDDYGT